MSTVSALLASFFSSQQTFCFLQLSGGGEDDSDRDLGTFTEAVKVKEAKNSDLNNNSRDADSMINTKVGAIKIYDLK